MVNVTASMEKFERVMGRVGANLNRWTQEMRKASRATKAFGRCANLFFNGRRDREQFATNYLWPGKRRFQPSFHLAVLRLREMFIRAAVVSHSELLPWQEKILEGLVHGPPRRRRRMLQGLGRRCGHSYTLGKLAEAKGVSVVNRGDGSKTSSVGEELLWALMQGAE